MGYIPYHTWAYGITTVPERRVDNFYRTLTSLYVAGFTHPYIFVDGEQVKDKYEHLVRERNLNIVTRYPRIGVVGNWILSLQELFIRNKTASRFAIFQDDIVTYPDLLQYLDKTKYPTNGYLNLYTSRDNEKIIEGKPDGWYEACELHSTAAATYHGKVQQKGLGALALIFSREAVITLMGSKHYIQKPLCVHSSHRRIDGSIVESMNREGWREYIHNPSLVQHTGSKSTIGEENNNQKLARSFKGEDYNLCKK